MAKQPFVGSDLVTQIGILVHDIEKAAQSYADFLGVDKPEIHITDQYEQAKTEYLGAPSPARTKQAFFTIGPNLQIELLEPDKAPSTWRHDLDEKGEGVHHIAFQVHGMQKVISRCEESGMKLLQKGQWATGRYAYIDANDPLKLVVELLEFDGK